MNDTGQRKRPKVISFEIIIWLGYAHSYRKEKPTKASLILGNILRREWGKYTKWKMKFLHIVDIWEM